MGIKKGLSVDGIRYFSDVISGEKKPDWMDFSQQIAKLTGKYELLNLVSGLKGLDTFLFRTPKWPIGGIYFDGILRTEHLSRVRPTQYPVQTGVVMTDHALVEPAELTVEIMMTDCAKGNVSFLTHNPCFDQFYQSLQGLALYSNFVQMDRGGVQGEGRSAQMWTTLKAMQLSRVPITVETRLQTYGNMIIEELSAPDDVKTLNALKTTVRMREIVFADVAEVKTAARPVLAKPVNGGQTAAKTNDNTTLKDGIGQPFGKGEKS